MAGLRSSHSLQRTDVILSAAAAEEDKLYGIYKTSALASITWSTDRVTTFDTEDIFKIERASSLYFSELLADKSHSAFQDITEVVSVAVHAKKQKVGNNYISLESVVEIINIGDDSILDVASLLMFLTNKNTTSSSFTALDQLMSVGYSIDMVSFSNDNETSSMVIAVDATSNDPVDDSKYTAKERALVTFTCILAFALFTVSAVLLWVAGGWLGLRKQIKILLHREEEMTRMGQQEIERKPTQETDAEAGSPTSSHGKETQFTNPSGILGVNPSYGKRGAMNGLGVKMTPARGIDNGDAASDVFTPMSQKSSYSDTGRIPLGITSMRKLVPGRDNMEADTPPRSSQRNSIGSFGMQRLDYDESSTK
eukprot:scaffold709_cov197-Cylindrotheca_fusiformis.AAC.1